MAYNSVIISSGHGLYVPGACGIVNEVEEARNVVNRVVKELQVRGVDVKSYHDDVSYTQSENLNRITDFHNDNVRDIDISVHFNAYEQVEKPMGVEVLFLTEDELAGKMSAAIAQVLGLPNRGAKQRTDLHFLNCCAMPAILIEVCFVDSECDCLSYRDNFDQVCEAIADVLAGNMGTIYVPPPELEEVCQTGRCSWFGGPQDDGVSDDEGLAFIYSIDQAPHLFLPYQPEGTTGLARRLNPYVHYCAMRFDYDVHPKETLLDKLVLVRNVKTGKELTCIPADWGPHGDTDRIIDLSPSMMADLELDTDDAVEVIFPYNE